MPLGQLLAFSGPLENEKRGQGDLHALVLRVALSKPLYFQSVAGPTEVEKALMVPVQFLLGVPCSRMDKAL